MSYIGGLFALYSLLEHSNVFGSAETSNRVCIIIDCCAALVLGLMSRNLAPIVALYPVAFAMSIQWCTFRGVQDNPSATTFSTGNFRQLVTIIFNYVTERNRTDLGRIRFYVITMLSFHAGIATMYLIWPLAPHRSIWIVFIPLAGALIRELRIAAQKKAPVELLEQSSGCEDV